MRSDDDEVGFLLRLRMNDLGSMATQYSLFVNTEWRARERQPRSRFVLYGIIQIFGGGKRSRTIIFMMMVQMIAYMQHFDRIRSGKLGRTG